MSWGTDEDMDRLLEYLELHGVECWPQGDVIVVVTWISSEGDVYAPYLELVPATGRDVRAYLGY